MKKLILFLISIFALQSSFAATVDTLKIYSPAMKRDVVCTIAVPDKIAKGETLPTLYMLHGHGGNYATWLKGYPIMDLVDKYRMIVVMPDGNYNSWYIDSPMDPTVRYETFLTKELLSYIDSNYPTIQDRSGRAITGLSMGGHGALYNAMRHQDLYGAAGSMSGGVDIRPFPKNWSLPNLLGEKSEHPENWYDYTVMGQLHLLAKDNLALIIDCGEQDFLFKANEALHRELQYLNVPHRYTTDAGIHNGVYWKKSIQYHFLFFSLFFNK